MHKMFFLYLLINAYCQMLNMNVLKTYFLHKLLCVSGFKYFNGYSVFLFKGNYKDIPIMMC